MGGVPPSVTTAAAAPAAASATVTVGEAPVKAVPEKLQDLARPVVLPGTVAGETADGLTRVRTQAGEVVIKSPLPLLTDRPVTLQIAAGQPPSLATILAPPASLATTPAQAPAAAPAVLVQIGGTPVPTPTPTSISSPTGTAAPAAPTPAAAPPVPGAATVPPAVPSMVSPIQPGALLPAVVLAVARNAPAPVARDAAGVPLSPAPLPATTPTAEPRPSLPAATAQTPASSPASAPAAGGSGLAAAALNAFAGPDAPDGNPVDLGGDAAHPGGGSDPSPAAKDGGLPRTAQPPGQSPAPPPVPLRPGGTVAVKILSLEPPTAQAPAFDGDAPLPDPPDGLPAGSVVVRGTVAGTTGEGRPILATRLGMLALGQGEALPKGTTLTVALSDPGAALEGIAGREVFLASSREWPALREALVTLAGIDRTLAQTLMNTVVPQPNRRMAAAVSFFLTAVRGGDARAWLGEEATETLRRNGRGDLLAALDREFRSMQQQAADPLPGGWHGFTLPVFDGAMLQPVRVHIHPIRDDEDGTGATRDRPPKGSRFVIDVDLSRLGPLQLDGMVRERRFDLILRSRAPLDPGLRDELTEVFSTSVGAVGFAGSLLFQADSRQWVALTPGGGGPRLGVTA